MTNSFPSQAGGVACVAMIRVACEIVVPDRLAVHSHGKLVTQLSDPRGSSNQPLASRRSDTTREVGGSIPPDPEPHNAPGGIVSCLV